MLIDTHCHLDFDWFDVDRDEVIDRALEAGVRRIVVPAVDLKGCQAAISLAEKYDTVFAAIGVHPNSSSGWQDSWLQDLRTLAEHEKVVAIGEIGLDTYRDRSPVETQERAFRLQLTLSAELRLPVIIHNRHADLEVLRLLSESPLMGMDRPGVLHSFSGGPDLADKALEMGFYLGFTGPVTFKKADNLRTLVAGVPKDRLLVETDAPFLSPHPFRGKRNEPARVRLILERIAGLHGLETCELAQITTENAVRLFGDKLAVHISHRPARH